MIIRVFQLSLIREIPAGFGPTIRLWEEVLGRWGIGVSGWEEVLASWFFPITPFPRHPIS